MVQNAPQETGAVENDGYDRSEIGQVELAFRIYLSSSYQPTLTFCSRENKPSLP